MENWRYRNGKLQVRGNARRPFRHARRGKKIANSATVHYSLLPIRCPDDTATVYYNYRHYEPVTGRWMQRDPIGEEGGIMCYGDLWNSAVMMMDRLGLAGQICSTGEPGESNLEKRKTVQANAPIPN